MTHRFDLVQQKVWKVGASHESAGLMKSAAITIVVKAPKKVTECNWARWEGAVMVIMEMGTPQAKQEYSDREGNISCNAQFE